jgi:YesN/AraC family two-component response regulator
MTPEPLPPLYGRIHYDVRLESRALSQLDRSDPRASRATFQTLIDRLDLSGADGSSTAVIQLLVDVLQEVNRRVHRGVRREAECQRHRMALIDSFASVQSASEARELFMPALDRLLRPLTKDRRAPHPLVQRAKSFIDQRYDGRLSLSRVAEALAISPNYLSRLFRKETGMTLTAYIQHARLEHAKRLLADDSRSIAEIAYRVGYQNYRDFYRNFVKYEKASPRRARQLLGEGVRIPPGGLEEHPAS